MNGELCGYVVLESIEMRVGVYMLGWVEQKWEGCRWEAC